MRSFLFALFIIEAFFITAGTAPVSARTSLSRQEIKSMPITTRPYRAGHFYGNTVRRRTHRGR